ncbi:hypothetical protein SAMN05216604_110129 [Pseudomonas agarici]|nr:hypothetical protein SAMN05216604_110129 [Pseudomonas agarici]
MAPRRETPNERNSGRQRGYGTRFSVGQIEYDPQCHDPVANLLAHADKARYAYERALKRR